MMIQEEAEGQLPPALLEDYAKAPFLLTPNSVPPPRKPRFTTSPPPALWKQLQDATVLEDDDKVDYYFWQNKPPPRTKFSLISYKDRLVIFGGGFQRIFHGDVYEYSFTTKAWRLIQNDAELVGGPCRRRSHKAILYQNKMVVFGGRLLYGRKNDVFSLNLDTYTWESHNVAATSGEQPAERAAHSAVLWNHHMIIFGGDSDLSGEQTYLNDLWQLSLTTFCWERLEPVGDCPTGRLGHDCVVCGDSMYLFGGYQGRALNDMYVLGLSVGVWRKINYNFSVECTSFLSMVGQPAPPCERSEKRPRRVTHQPAKGWPHKPTTEVHTDELSGLLVWGGSFTERDKFSDTLYRFDIATEEFDRIEVTGAKPKARLGHAMTYRDNQLYLLCGCDFEYYNDMYSLELKTPTLFQLVRQYIIANNISYSDDPERMLSHLPGSAQADSFLFSSLAQGRRATLRPPPVANVAAG